MTRVNIRAARGDDAEAIVDIIRAGFETRLVELFIYGCAGVAPYVRQQIAATTQGGDTHYAVATANGTVGCVEMRMLRDRLFLNYIAVVPRAQRGGAANRLLHAAIHMTRSDQRALSLDVLEHNAVAIAWYRGLGFTEEGSTEWWTMPLGQTDALPGYVIGLPQAQTSHDAFGFSRFAVSTTVTRDVGMLGERWFRVTDPTALVDSELRAALQRVDGERDLLALLPAGKLPAAVASSATRITATRRMSIDLDVLVNTLEEKLA